MEQVEYTIYPPVLDLASQLSMAAINSSFCKCEHLFMSASSLLILTSGSLEMTPVPLQGASSRTLSKHFKNWKTEETIVHFFGLNKAYLRLH